MDSSAPLMSTTQDLPNPDHVLLLAKELNLKVHQVAATAELLKSGATVPFISRYRKEATGELDEVQVTAIRDRMEQLAQLDDRRAAILASLTERNLLTDALKSAIGAATTLQQLEDIYLPFRPKKRTRATIAKEKGLEPLAELLWAQDPATDVAAAAAALVGHEFTLDDGKNTKGKIESAEDALAGARDILAERISDDASVREKLRVLYRENAVVSSKVMYGKETEGAKFKDYFDWSEPLAKAPSHRIMAMRRGENESFLIMRITLPDEAAGSGIVELHFAKGSSPARRRRTPARSTRRTGDERARHLRFR